MDESTSPYLIIDYRNIYFPRGHSPSGFDSALVTDSKCYDINCSKYKDQIKSNYFAVLNDPFSVFPGPSRNQPTCHSRPSQSNLKIGDTSDPCQTSNAAHPTDCRSVRRSTTPFPTTRTPEPGESGLTTSRDNPTLLIQTAPTSKRESSEA